MPKGIDRWAFYVQRYKNGEWRTPIFRDLVLADAQTMQGKAGGLTMLDIGCGGGFDCDARFQQQLSDLAVSYIGIEPDTEITLSEAFTDVHHCLFEEAPIADDVIDIAFAVMVLEHICDPQRFWDKIHHILRKGGVFWGFTVDARHWFVFASMLMEKLHVKDWYLDRLHGRRGEARYENYDVFYRCNSPKRLTKQTKQFASTTCINFNKMGQLDYYLPRKLRFIGRAIDGVTNGLGLPGGLLAVRVEK